MLPARYNPFGSFPPLFSLRRDIDRLFSDWMKDLGSEVDVGDVGEIGAIAPRLDLVEKGDAYMLRADVPGVDPEDVKVNVSGNVLTIEGEKREERSEGEEGGTERFRERVWRRYERSVTLPESVDASRIEAQLEHGVLTLTLPKSEQSKPRQIQVKGGAKGPKQIEAAKTAEKPAAGKQEKKKGAA